MRSAASMPRTELSKPSPAAGRAAKARAARRWRPVLPARTAPWSDPTGRSISATPKTTGSAGWSGRGDVLSEKLAQCGHQVLWVVALDSVSGLRDRDLPAVGKILSQTLGILLVEYVALGAAHDQGGAGDVGEVIGEPAPLGEVRVVIEP